MNIIKLANINKTYESGKLNVPVLFNISLEIRKGDMVAITGPSGSGKSTLMNLIGLLDRPTGGQIFIDEKEIKMSMSDKKLAQLRSDKIGFVFQSFHLLPKLSALENVMMPSAYYKKTTKRNIKKHTLESLDRMGLKDRAAHKPTELSGGEKQRIAMARSLINDPEIILADEPTGNLDSKSGKMVLDTLRELSKEDGKTVVVITHDKYVSDACNYQIKLFDGKIES